MRGVCALKKHLESVAVPNKHTNFSIQKSCQNEAWLVRPPKYLPLPLIIEGRQKRLAAARGNWLNENYLKFWVYTWSVFSSWLEIGVFQKGLQKQAFIRKYQFIDRRWFKNSTQVKI